MLEHDVTEPAVLARLSDPLPVNGAYVGPSGLLLRERFKCSALSALGTSESNGTFYLVKD